MKNFDFKTALLTVSSTIVIAAAAPAAQPILLEGGPTTSGPGGSGGPQLDTDRGRSYCEGRGVETVPGKVSMVGPVIDCDGSFELALGVNGIGGELTWSGVGCPTFIELIPQHDKSIQKPHFRIVGKQFVPRQQLSFTCVDGGWFGSDDCVSAGQNLSLPYVAHYFEEACPLSNGASF